jgi:hypothetical protein
MDPVAPDPSTSPTVRLANQLSRGHSGGAIDTERGDDTRIFLKLPRPPGHPDGSGSIEIEVIFEYLKKAPQHPRFDDSFYRWIPRPGCLLSCHVKSLYDRLAQVEIELGEHDAF